MMVTRESTKRPIIFELSAVFTQFTLLLKFSRVVHTSAANPVWPNLTHLSMQNIEKFADQNGRPKPTQA
jgi:hypothetical protein